MSDARLSYANAKHAKTYHRRGLMNAMKHSGGWGVPLPRLKAGARVALSAASPRSFLAVGFPLQSLTRNAISLVALCFAFCLSAQVFDPYRFMPKELLREKRVKCITVYSASPNGTSKYQELCFDELGRQVQVLTFFGSPVQTDTAQYVYDATGREVSYSSIQSVAYDFPEGKDPLMKKVNMSYTSQYVNGKLVKYIGNEGAYAMSGSHFTELRYDSLGQLIEQVYHDTINHTTQRAVLVNDKNGREILSLYYDKVGQITSFEVKRYDENGRVTDSALRNTGRHSDHYTITRYFYDPAGKLIREERVDDGKHEMIVYEYRYDHSGLLTQLVSNVMNQSFEYTYY